MKEIRDAMGKGVLTPNFESEFLRLFGDKIEKVALSQKATSTIDSN